ncbi:hypothetical protein CHS0354_010742 [Potamilus streckersoni]|uniref:Ribosomal protein eL8/eL30/eS12/Gadd45 domain-containing protein n=1 Tax=Potamilus streckersoni TaxID=2493646 RepID=A0AAE0W9K0_9BIVA|nr:hypothetical protein CHS0354_010742 [Potamilus streckersoni]
MDFITEISFPDFDDNATIEETKTLLGSDVTMLMEMLIQATDEEQLISGVYECANILENAPDCVKLCLLPVINTSNISVHIQHKLIEAYCWENEISIIKIINAEKLAQYLRFKRNLNINATLTCMIVTDTKHPHGNRSLGSKDDSET